jgi:hypothetical protein
MRQAKAAAARQRSQPAEHRHHRFSGHFVPRRSFLIDITWHLSCLHSAAYRITT